MLSGRSAFLIVLQYTTTSKGCKEKSKKKSSPPRGRALYCGLVFSSALHESLEGVALKACRILGSLLADRSSHCLQGGGIGDESLETGGQFLSSEFFHATQYPIAYGMRPKSKKRKCVCKTFHSA